MIHLTQKIKRKKIKRKKNKDQTHMFKSKPEWFIKKIVDFFKKNQYLKKNIEIIWCIGLQGSIIFFILDFFKMSYIFQGLILSFWRISFTWI